MRTGWRNRRLLSGEGEIFETRSSVEVEAPMRREDEHIMIEEVLFGGGTVQSVVLVLLTKLCMTMFC